MEKSRVRGRVSGKGKQKEGLATKCCNSPLKIIKIRIGSKGRLRENQDPEMPMQTMGSSMTYGGN